MKIEYSPDHGNVTFSSKAALANFWGTLPGCAILTDKEFLFIGSEDGEILGQTRLEDIVEFKGCSRQCKISRARIKRQ